MKKEDIANALNETEETYLESAENMRNAYAKKKQKHAFFVRTGIAVTAMACAAAGIVLISKPQQNEPPAVIDRTPEPAAPSPAPLPLETVVLPSSGSAAAAGVMAVEYPDYSSETDYNPWTENMNLTQLPVCKRPSHPAGVEWGLDEQEIRTRMDRVAEILGMTPYNYQVAKGSDSTISDTPADAVTDITAETDEATIRASGYGEVTVFFKKGHEIILPDNLDFTYDIPEEKAEETISWLYDQYKELLGSDTWGYDLGGDYAYDGHPIRQYRMYAAGRTDAETMLNYTYRTVQFAPDNSGNLYLIRVKDQLACAECLGDYPLISMDEAYELLYQGNCISSFTDAPSRSAKIADVQLVYTDFNNYEYQIPYYRFLVDITGQYGMLEHNGLRTYGIYLVPAIEREYYMWEDEAEKEQTSSVSAEPEQTDIPEESPEPTLTPAEETDSSYISVDRITQENSWYCTVACVQMILNHFGIQKDQSTLAKEMNTYAPGERDDGISGTFDTDAARVLNEYLFNGQPDDDSAGGYRVQPLSAKHSDEDQSLMIRRIRKNIDDGYPSILQIKVNELYGGDTAVNHNVIVTGYRRPDKVTYLTILDPYYGDTGIFEFDEYTVYRAVIESVDPSYIW